MQVRLELTGNLKPQLVVTSDNDMEAIALRAWSEKYFHEDAPIALDKPSSEPEAYFLVEMFSIQENE